MHIKLGIQEVDKKILDDKKGAWEIWGREFIPWLIDIYKIDTFKMKRKALTPELIKESFETVVLLSNFWSPKLVGMDKDIIEEALMETAEDCKTILKDIIINTSPKGNLATVAGILKWHLKYFFGHGKIEECRSILLNRKIDTIKRALTRASYDDHYYLNKYKSEANLYFNNQTSKFFTDTEHLMILGGEIKKVEEWWKQEEEKLNSRTLLAKAPE